MTNTTFLEQVQNNLAESDNQTGKTMDRVHPNSRANRIAELEVNKSYSESVRVDVDKVGKDEINNIKADMRNVINKAANNAAKRSGNEFTVEAGEFFTRSYDLLICVVVTRVK